jgi:hypothetical protein
MKYGRLADFIRHVSAEHDFDQNKALIKLQLPEK